MSPFVVGPFTPGTRNKCLSPSDGGGGGGGGLLLIIKTRGRAWANGCGMWREVDVLHVFFQVKTERIKSEEPASLRSCSVA